MISILLFLMAGWFVIGIIGTVATIGKPRKPLEGYSAAFTVLTSFLFTVVIIIAGIQLSGV